jgi:putative DNA methylase
VTEPATYPKRLIEVDLPIKRISEHARREKSIRHGHISTLHIWWARRPLAACRAVICAALWLDPADPLCPEGFREVARAQMRQWAAGHLRLMSNESYNRFVEIKKKPELASDNEILRRALLDFIADFANWDNSTKKEYLNISRILTQAAHEAVGGMPGTRPLVIDPFAGGGSIPLEALRVGADAFASDLNPIPVLLNKVMLEYMPKYGEQLADDVRKGGAWLKEQAEKELANIYPLDPDGATPIAYLWARTIRCEGPGCGAEIPLMRSLWLAKRGNRSVVLKLVPNHENKQIQFEIVNSKEARGGTIRKGSATCPVCEFTIPNDRVRAQLAERHGGAADARLIAVVTTYPDRQGRHYRLPNHRDIEAIQKAKAILEGIVANYQGPLSFIPNELISTERPSPNARGLSAVSRIGMRRFSDLFAPRQLLWLAYVADKLNQISAEQHPSISALLALALGRQADQHTSVVTWLASIEAVSHTFTRQAIQIAWDYVEPNPFSNSGGNWDGAIEWVAKVCESNNAAGLDAGTIQQLSATSHSLPSDSAAAFITDPPYYDSVPYADLSDFFYVWLRRALRQSEPELFGTDLTPKDEEAIWNPSRIHTPSRQAKDIQFYERQMLKAFEEGRRLTMPSGIGVVVFAHKSTSGWEAMLSALIESGWIATGSWTIDTERGNRVNAIGTASLASSVHIVVRPREAVDGSPRVNIGDWRDVLRELPIRIHEWMPRLTKEGVVGADAIFACLGPALEIFSRYSSVEKANGDKVTLKEYLEYVWAAVAKEAFKSIFEGADTTGFEEDARLTAIWFWVMKEAANGNGNHIAASELDDTEDDDGEKSTSAEGKKTSQGYVMEYDAIRKLAQGLGVNLHNLSQPNGIITIKGNTAMLNSVLSRASYLLGRQLSLFENKLGTRAGKRQERLSTARLKTVQQRQGQIYDPQPALKFSHLEQPLFPELNQEDTRSLLERLLENGSTMLDRLHQSMLLFAHSHSTLLRSLLVETRFASDPQFWRLAQALLALYPNGSDEKRWVEGVLSRKKSLGF